MEFHLSAFISGVYLLQPKPKLLMKAIREAGQVSDTQKSLSEWLEEAGNTLFDRGIEYGDPRHNLLRIFKISKALGIQLRDPSELAIIAIATKLSRMVESPKRDTTTQSAGQVLLPALRR